LALLAALEGAVLLLGGLLPRLLGTGRWHLLCHSWHSRGFPSCLSHLHLHGSLRLLERFRLGMVGRPNSSHNWSNQGNTDGATWSNLSGNQRSHNLLSDSALRPRILRKIPSADTSVPDPVHDSFTGENLGYTPELWRGQRFISEFLQGMWHSVKIGRTLKPAGPHRRDEPS